MENLLQNRTIRIRALKNIQNGELIKVSDNKIIKEAQLDTIVGRLKDIFSRFYNSVKSSFNSDNPIASIAEFLAVGALWRINPVLGLIFSALEVFLDIDIETVFTKIRNAVTSILSSPAKLQLLQQNPDRVIYDIVSDAVNPETQSTTDAEVNNRIQQGELQNTQHQTTSSIDYNTLVKNAESYHQMVKVGRGYPRGMFSGITNLFSRGFGGGIGGIKGAFFWLLKTFLLGIAAIGAVGTGGSYIRSLVSGVSDFISPSTTTTTTPPTTISPSLQTPDSGQPARIMEPTRVMESGRNILRQLRLVQDMNITMTRENNAPDNANISSDSPEAMWTIPNPSSRSISDVLYDWLTRAYSNLADVVQSNNVSENKLMAAVNSVASTFSGANLSSSPNPIRVPRMYKSVQQILERIVSQLG